MEKHREQIQSIKAKEEKTGIENAILKVVKKLEKQNLTDTDKIHLDTLFRLYELQTLIDTVKQREQLSKFIKEKFDVSVGKKSEEVKKLTSPVVVKKPGVTMPEKEEKIPPSIKRPGRTLFGPDRNIPHVHGGDTEEEINQDPEVIVTPEKLKKPEQPQDTIESEIKGTVVFEYSKDISSLRKFVRNFLEGFSKNAQQEGLPKESYYQEKGGKVYIQAGHDLLKKSIEQSIGGLSSKEKEELKSEYFSFNSFYDKKDSDGKIKRVYITQRIYLLPFIGDRKILPVDKIQESLKEGGAVPDAKLRTYISEMISESIFDGKQAYTLHGVKIDLKKNKENIMQNMETLLRFVMDVESDFRNVSNEGSENPSSAKGILQYLNGEIHGIVNTDYYDLPNSKFTSFQTGINKARILFSKLSLSSPKHTETKEFFEKAQKKSRESFLYSSLELTTEQEILLFLGELFCMSGEKKHPELKDLFIQTLISGDASSMREIYESYHHRDPDRPTESRLNKKMKIHAPKLQNIIPEDKREDIFIYSSLASLTSSSLSKGSKGNRVQLLQSGLILLGEKIDEVTLGTTTRYYGNATEKAIIKFQKDKDIIESPTDEGAGVFGPKTREIFRKALEQKVDSILAKRGTKYKKQDVIAILNGTYVDNSTPIKKKQERNISSSIGKVKSVDYTRVLLPEVTRKNLFRKKTPKKSTFEKKHLTNYDRVIRYYREAKAAEVLSPNVSNFRTAKELLKSRDLVKIERETSLWKLGSSIVRKSKTEGRDGLLYLTPDSKQILQEILKRFQKKLTEEYAFPKGYSVRVVINSLLRPKSYNKSVGGHPKSAHMRGIGFDFRHHSFEVFNENTGTYTLVTENNIKGKGVSIDGSLTRAIRNVLFEVLKEFDTNGKTILTKEGHHPHITVKEGYKEIIAHKKQSKKKKKT